jgi:hypothetical protein
LADPESQKTTITITKNEMKLTTSTHMGTVKDSLPFNHGDVTAEVNAAYLQRAIRHCDQMAILENCCLFQKTPNVLQIVSNMG